MAQLCRTPSPSPGTETGFPLNREGGGQRAGSILLLELLSLWKHRAGTRSVNIERAAASQERSEEPHYRAFLPAGLDGAGGSLGDPPASPPSTSISWPYPIPLGAYLGGSGSRGLLLTQPVRELWGQGHEEEGQVSDGSEGLYCPNPRMPEITAKEPPGTQLFQTWEPSYLKSFFMLFIVATIIHNHARLPWSKISLRQDHLHGPHCH